MDPVDDVWGGLVSRIDLDASRFGPGCLEGLDQFTHVEIVFLFHRVDEKSIHTGARHPRGRAEWPKAGIFAQRAKNRPNRIGVTVCRLLRVEPLAIEVEGLDAIDGTPVLDIKPFLREFAPPLITGQPRWATEMMSSYWSRAADSATPEDYTITDDITRIDIARVHRYLSEESYWAKGIPFEVVDRAVRNSLSFAVLDAQGGLAGFARVITDRATFAYLADVFILDAHRGKGLSKRLMAAIGDHPQLQDLRRWMLATQDAHGLYSQYAGFRPIRFPERWMERHDPDVYARRAAASTEGES